MSHVKDKEVLEAIAYGLWMGETRIPKPTKARTALANNLKSLMENYPAGFNRGISSRDLEKAIAERFGVKVSYKSIDRMKNPFTESDGPTFGSIDTVAAFFNVATWDLITPRPALMMVNAERPTQEAALRAPSIAKSKKRTGR